MAEQPALLCGLCDRARVQPAYRRILEPLGLTYPQYLAMLVLWEQDGLTVKDIGRRLCLELGTLTPVLKRLEAIGYVHRTRDPSDERQVRVALTPHGRELRSGAQAGRRALACAVGRSEEQIQALKRELDELEGRVARRRRRSRRRNASVIRPARGGGISGIPPQPVQAGNEADPGSRHGTAAARPAGYS